MFSRRLTRAPLSWPNILRFTVITRKEPRIIRALFTYRFGQIDDRTTFRHWCDRFWCDWRWCTWRGRRLWRFRLWLAGRGFGESTSTFWGLSSLRLWLRR
jgi:hypothetical protein